MSSGEWTLEEAFGWTAHYRIVERYAFPLPARVDGAWVWRTHHFALQVMYEEEQPPTGWITVARSRSKDELRRR